MAIPSRPHYAGHKGAVYALCPAMDPGQFLSGSGDGSVVRWTVGEASGLTVAHIGRAVFALHLNTKERCLFIGDEDGGLHVTDLAERRETQLERAHRKGIFAITALPDGRIACAGGDGVLSIWAHVANRWTAQRNIPLCDEKLRGLALDAEGGALAVACGDGTVRILDPKDLNERFTIHAHTDGANSVAWHPSKPVLVSGGKDGHLRLWRSDADFTELLAIPAHSGSIYAIAFSPDGSLCATASRDKTAKLWNAQSFDPLRRLDRAAGGHGYSVNAVLWMGPRILLTGSDDKSIAEWSNSTAG